MGDAETLGDIIDARVEGEETANRARLGAGAFLDQRVHLSDGVQFGAQFLRESQSTSETGRWVTVHGQHIPTRVGVHLSEQRCQRRLAYTSLTTNCKFHDV